MEVIVVVPIYKTSFNAAEVISLQQLFRVLNKYDICFIMPESLSFNAKKYCAMEERFPDEYFVSTISYSQLLTSEAFYQRFCSYDYMLLYQLDAFVFSDRLAEFSNLGFDYIGAPVPICAWPLKIRVGNGGLSLRRIQGILQILPHRNTILRHAEKILSPRFYRSLCTVEDIFFAYCGNFMKDVFHLAPVNVAADFSVEFDIGHWLYRRVMKKRPFGCHRWYNGQIDFWKPFIEDCGYDLRELIEQGLAWGDGRRSGIYAYLLTRLSKSSADNIREALSSILPNKSQFSIWGCGGLGHRLYSLLCGGDYKVHKFFDTASRNKLRLLGLDSEIPTASAVRDAGFIIVAVRKDREVCNSLASWGMCEGKDYIRFANLEKDIAQWWFKKMHHKKSLLLQNCKSV